jgi:DNA-binding transcriptional ArsR family regulator
MEKTRVMEALDALAQETRLDLFRVLVRAGAGGMTPTALSRQLKIAPPTLSFHLGRLTHAGLITSRRRGRSIAYAANGAAIDTLIAYLDSNFRQPPAPPPAPKEPEAKKTEPPAPAPAKDAQAPKRADAPAKKPEAAEAATKTSDD